MQARPQISNLVADSSHFMLRFLFVRCLNFPEAGDDVEIFFKNFCDVPVNIEPSGSEWSLPNVLPPVVQGRVVSFTWSIPLSAGPAPGDSQSSRLYLYRSSVNPVRHENGGLSGPLIVTRKGDAKEDGSAADVDRDIVTVFEVQF
jgi:hypothetical protein